MDYNLTQIPGACKLDTVCISTKVDVKKGKNGKYYIRSFNKM